MTDAVGVNVPTCEKAGSAKDRWRMSILPKPHPHSGCFIDGHSPEIKRARHCLAFKFVARRDTNNRPRTHLSILRLVGNQASHENPPEVWRTIGTEMHFRDI